MFGSDGTGVASFDLNGVNRNASWSPDGTLIAYSHQDNNAVPPEVFTITPAGTATRQLTDAGEGYTVNEWTTLPEAAGAAGSVGAPSAASLTRVIASGLPVRFSCAAACTARSRLLLRKAVIGSGTKRLTAGGDGTVRVRLTSRARSRLRGARRVSAKLRTTLVDAGGDTLPDLLAHGDVDAMTFKDAARLSAILLALAASPAALAAPGEPDRSFGENGTVLLDLGGAEGADALLPLPGGAFVVAGYGDGTNVSARFTASGARDASYGDRGVVVTSSPGASGAGVSPVPSFRQDDGRLVSAGAAAIGSGTREDPFTGGTRLAVYRTDANGRPDPGLGSGGTATLPGEANQAARAILALQQTGGADPGDRHHRDQRPVEHDRAPVRPVQS